MVMLDTVVVGTLEVQVHAPGLLGGARLSCEGGAYLVLAPA